MDRYALLQVRLVLSGDKLKFLGLLHDEVDDFLPFASAKLLHQRFFRTVRLIWLARGPRGCVSDPNQVEIPYHAWLPRRALVGRYMAAAPDMVHPYKKIQVKVFLFNAMYWSRTHM
jgi:hypothetical protein